MSITISVPSFILGIALVLWAYIPFKLFYDPSGRYYGLDLFFAIAVSISGIAFSTAVFFAGAYFKWWNL